MTRKASAEEVSVSTRYLANIELGLIIPSVPVMLRLIQICHLPVERYFNPALIQENSEVRQRVRHKMQLCTEKYLPIVEATFRWGNQNERVRAVDFKVNGSYSYALIFISRSLPMVGPALPPAVGPAAHAAGRTPPAHGRCRGAMRRRSESRCCPPCSGWPGRYYF